MKSYSDFLKKKYHLSLETPIELNTNILQNYCRLETREIVEA